MFTMVLVYGGILQRRVTRDTVFTASHSEGSRCGEWGEWPAGMIRRVGGPKLHCRSEQPEVVENEKDYYAFSQSAL